MDAYPELDGQTDVVFSVHWTLNGTDGTYNGSVYGSVGVTLDPDAPFVPYASLTLAQVIGWVQDALGEEQVASYEANVAQQLVPTQSPLQVPSLQPTSVRLLFNSAATSQFLVSENSMLHTYTHAKQPIYALNQAQVDSRISSSTQTMCQRQLSLVL